MNDSKQMVEEKILHEFDVYSFNPVSYTHLDVYKRQVLIIIIFS